MLQYRFLCIIIWYSLLNAQTEIPVQIVKLLDKKSYVEYKFIEWNYAVDGPQLTLPIRFRTRSIDGRLITLSARGIEDNIFILSAFIDNAAVVVDLIDGQQKIIRKTKKQLLGVNNGMEYSMSIQLNLERKMLKMIYGEGAVDSYDFTNHIKVENRMQLAITIGSDKGLNSVIGCVTIVGLTIGNRFVFELKEKKRSENVKSDCEMLCTKQQCNKGSCIDLFHTAVCNCRGTYQSGEQCDEAVKTLNVSWDQYISYKIDDDESQPTIISIDFKTEVNEGLIIHGRILSRETNEPIGKLKLALIYGQLRLTVANLAEISFDNITIDSNKFNQILLEFEYNANMVRMIFNGYAKSASLNVDDKDYHIRFDNELFFCAGDIEVGLSGCLRGIYVDYFDVINGYDKHSSKVNANAELKSCDRNVLITVTAPDTEILPVLNTGEILLDGTTEEQIDGYNTGLGYEFGLDQEHDQVNSEMEHHYHNQMRPEEDIRWKAIIETPMKQFCENSETTNCKNSIECIKKDDLPVCVCRKGFVGSSCQFSLLPWNCDEIFRDGNTVSGTYIIDPDGSGPLPETYAYCENGKTIIAHNMPDNTIINSKGLGDIHMIVNYKFFNDELLQSLKRNSESCSQIVQYSCHTAPLRFDRMKIWFKSISNEFFRGFGGVDGTCPCQNDKCTRCNCDNDDVASDYGTMTDSEVPIRGIYRLNDLSVDKGYMTLGPLICVGSAGQSDAYTMTIRDRFSSVEIGTWNVSTLSFEFRTYLESATLLSSSDETITITMLERTFYLQIDGQINLSLIPQSRKNDGYWHRIIVDIRDGSVRFSVDDTIITTIIKHHSFSSVHLSIGGGTDGFLGCIRQIILNDTLQEIHQTLRSKCMNKCESHDCQHESRCEEDFVTDTVRCICKNAIVHSGHLCENSINYGTEVSFHDSKKAFLKAENISIENALMQRIIFSFRTDQRDALLIYLHDQLYNFVQVHLSDHSRMVLTLNFNRTIYRCEVIAKIGNEYSRMKWIQVMIFQWSDSVELNVNDEICQIAGERILSNNFIKKFEITQDIGDIIQPPVSPITDHSIAFNYPYVLLFVAGVPTEIHFGNLEPIYRSTIPNLLGCVRGLMISGKLIDMRNQHYWSYYPPKPDLIKFGCKMGCQKIEHLCKNGGHCLVEWEMTKNTENIVSCNCARTSYYGKYCDEDNGAYFAGNSILILDTAEIFEKVIFDWNEADEQTFSFVFSTTNTAKSTKLTKPQIVATIYFKHNRMLQVILCKNGSINIGITSSELSFVYTFPYNYNDGYRHYLHSRFRANKSLKVTIDSWKYDFPSYLTADLSLAYAIKFSFGGSYITDISDMTRGDKETIKYNYTGCLSNIDIDVNVARMRLKPISYLYKSELKFAESVTIIGDKIQLGACNSFLIPGSLPPLLNTVEAPLWDSPFITEPYQRPNDNEMNVGEAEESEWWIIPFIISLILLIIFVGIFFFSRHKKWQQSSVPPKNLEVPSKDPESSPLISTKNDKQTLVIKNDFDLPEPDQQLDTVLPNRNSGDSQSIKSRNASLTVETAVITIQQAAINSRASIISGISGVTAYFTANTGFDTDDDDDYEDFAHHSQADDNGDNDDNCHDDMLRNCKVDDSLESNCEKLSNLDNNLSRGHQHSDAVIQQLHQDHLQPKIKWQWYYLVHRCH
ncbi:Laminin G domain family protein [Acanthocheilonema viteae]